MNKVDHIPHLEDLIFSSDANKLPELITQMIKCLDTGIWKYSIKYDGSPSLILGADPADGKFFLATKSLFNKTGAVYYKSREEVEAITKPGLREDLLEVWDAYSPLTFGGIWQGDLMWTRKYLKEENGWLTFCTNTLTYGAYDMTLCRIIEESKVGIVFHTRYEGKSLSELCIAPDRGVPPHSVEACTILPGLRMNGPEGFVPNVHPELVAAMHVDPEVLPHLKKFFAMNAGAEPLSPFTERFLGVIADHYMAEEEDRKSVRGKIAVRERYNHVALWVMAHKAEIIRLFVYYRAIIAVKELIRKQLEKRAFFSCFLREEGELVLTEQEGFVFRDEQLLVKLVDRNGFTVANRLNSLNIRR